MADAVTSQVILNDKNLYVLHLTNISDGTGESAITKIDVSTLTAGYDAATCLGVDLLAVQWAIQGFTYISLLFDATTDDLACIIPSGVGYLDYSYVPHNSGGNTVRSIGLFDPRSTGTTGDLKLTTTGAASGSTYDLTIWCRKRSAY